MICDSALLSPEGEAESVRPLWHSWASVAGITENILLTVNCQKVLGFIQANLYSRTILDEIC